MSSCPNQNKNMKSCNCTYEPCSRKGLCCECISYHRRSGELPACYFSPQGEKTFDRSIDNYLKHRGK
ncbi:MAG: hypothetical protein HQM10_05255 [Candidatus Riflebacteria bacterium]|nr:hypothetical protein [Candidatus Riflebacteria bacterium]